MVGITEDMLKTIEKKMGMIGVIHKDGWHEKRLTVQDLVDAYRSLREEISNERFGEVLAENEIKKGSEPGGFGENN